MPSLFSCFSSIQDPRRSEGLRTGLPEILSMVTLSAMAGHTGYRPVEAFCKANAAVLTQELSLKHAIPSHVTFRTVLNQIDHGQLIDAFHRWTEHSIAHQDVLAGDGKALGSTVRDSQGNGQNYQAVVSLFSQKTGLVTRVGCYQNAQKGQGEGALMRELITQLKGRKLLITLDALHTQKNGGNHY